MPKIEPGEHVAVVGEIGSGKTILARHIILRMPVKKRFIFYPKTEDDDIWKGFKNANKYDSEEQLSAQLAGLIHKNEYPDSVILIEDSQAIIENRSHGNYNKELSRLVLTGRKGGCTVVNVLHHARRYPYIVRMQTRHWFLARPSILGESIARDMFGDSITDMTLGLGDHEFLYVNSTSRIPQRLAAVKFVGQPDGRQKADVIHGEEQTKKPKNKVFGK